MKKSLLYIRIAVLVFIFFIMTFKAYAANGYFNSFNSLAAGDDPTGWQSTGDWGIVSGPVTPSWGVHEDYTKYYRYNSGTTNTYYNKTYTDFDYTVGMILTSDTTGAVIFRRTNDTNYYYFKLDAVNNRATVGKCVNGTNTDLAVKAVTINPDIWYYLRVTAKGQNIVCKVLDGNSSPYYTIIHTGTEVANINDATFSSGTCGFLATGTTSNLYNNVAITDSSLDKSMSNSIFSVKTGAYGEIKELKFLDEPYDTNFVSNENTHRTKVGPNQFLGEMKFKYAVGTEPIQIATTGNSDDTRSIALDSANKKITVSYLTDSVRADGIKNFQLTTTYSLADDYLQMDIKLKNTSSQTIRFHDIGLPITWNNNWQYEWDNNTFFKRYLAGTSNYISNHSSYIMLERAAGGGNKLVVTPVSSTDTQIEYRKFYSTEGTFHNPPEEYFIKSNAIKSEGQGYLPNTYLDLASNEEKTYSFRMHKASDYLHANNIIYNEGLIDAKVTPGMVLSKDMPAKLDLHTSKTINSVVSSDPGTVISYVETRPGDHKIYSVTFDKLGRNDITITYDGNKKSVLQFWVMEPIKDALQRRTDFLMNNCRITDPNDPHYKGFKEWNNSSNTGKLGGNNCNNNDFEQMYDGPAFIAEKNVYYPVQTEVTAIDDYLLDLVWAKEVIHGGTDDGFLSHGCCGGRCWLDANPAVAPYKCTRDYNYPRIYNTFYSMYKVARNYPNLTFRWTKNQYLEAAAKILNRSFDVAAMHGSRGTMGEQTVEEICRALEQEGYVTMASDFRARATARYNAINSMEFPFFSEFPADNTAEEGAYFFGKMNNDTSLMGKTVNKILAWLGRTPTWYYQTTGNRQDNDWWIFQYTVGLQGKALTDWYMNYTDNAADYWPMVYPSKIAPFVHIMSGQPEINLHTNAKNNGSVWWVYKPTRPYNWDIGWPYNESGEADISLWAGLVHASSDVVTNDPSFGLAGYGCSVADGGTTYNVTPKDGLFKKLNIVDKKLSIEIEKDRYSFAKVEKSIDSIEFTLVNVSGTSHTGTISIKGLVAGNYDVIVDGVVQTVVSVPSTSELKHFTYNMGTNETYNVIVRRNNTQLLVAEAGNNATIKLPASASLNGSVVGTPASITWSKVSGPGTVTFGNASELSTTASFSTAGTYTLQLAVSDDMQTSTDTVIIVVNPVSTVYEAENAALSGCFVSTARTGYTGTGFVDGFINGAVGTSVTFNVYAPDTGTFDMDIRYSYEYSPNYTGMGLYVNGIRVKGLSFQQTGSFSNWAALRETVNLNSGSNTIMLRVETVSGHAIMLDNIDLYADSTTTNIAIGATASTSYCSPWETIAALNDGYDPAHSNDKSHGAYGNWNNPGTIQWVQYDFSQSYTIDSMEVYWFDDDLGIDLPASCSIQYWNGSAWVNVSNPVGLGVSGNQYNKTTFTPVTTNKIRLNITAKSTHSTGILEWKVYGT